MGDLILKLHHSKHSSVHIRYCFAAAPSVRRLLSACGRKAHIKVRIITSAFDPNRTWRVQCKNVAIDPLLPNCNVRFHGECQE